MMESTLPREQQQHQIEVVQKTLQEIRNTSSNLIDISIYFSITIDNKDDKAYRYENIRGEKRRQAHN